MLHDNYDCSFDLNPAKRKLPLNNNRVEMGNFNVH